MAKFAVRTSAPTGPIRTTGPATTFEGGPGFARDAKSDLFLLAATNMVGEDTYYEAKTDRDRRFRDLVHAATVADPDWVARFVPYLRGHMNMRSASVVMAAESALARRGNSECAARATIPVRRMISDALQRPDEPAELIAYWRSRTGIRAIPGGVQRGLGDAVARLLTERAAIKYDSVGNAFRLADIVAIAKPTPVGPWQADLFDWLADRRWKRENVRVSDRLPIVGAYMAAKAMPEAERRAFFLADPGRLRAAGMTWEELSSLGPMDRQAWEAIAPTLGYMAALRNLRNMDEAGVSDEVAVKVAAKLSDPVEVAGSRQFPYRILSAYLAAPSLRWGHALELALSASTKSIPDLPGRTLVLVDTSASMTNPVSAKSKIRHVDIGALIGVALAHRGCQVDLVGFADGTFVHPVAAGGSMLRGIAAFTSRIGEVGHGTRIVESVQARFAGHDRVIVVSDMQTFAPVHSWPSYDVLGRVRHQTVSDVVPERVPMFGINTTGYATAVVDSSRPNRFEVGGFSDKAFTMFAALSAGDGSWPF